MTSKSNMKTLRYNTLCGKVTQIVAKLKLLKGEDPVRIQATEQLLRKLYIITFNGLLDMKWE